MDVGVVCARLRILSWSAGGAANLNAKSLQRVFSAVGAFDLRDGHGTWLDCSERGRRRASR
jgi:hypothetical protein